MNRGKSDIGDRYAQFITHKTARFSTNEDLREVIKKTGKGIWIGANWLYPRQGNFLVVGGSRSGKGTSLILPNLLSNNYEGSIFCIDPKGENAAISVNYQSQRVNANNVKRQVRILDPWRLQEEISAEHNVQPSRFNPLDILDVDSINLADDCDMIAEMLIPLSTASSDPYFNDRARQLISAYLMFMVVKMERHEITLYHLRTKLLQETVELVTDFLDMTELDHELHGDIINTYGSSFKSLFSSSDKEAGSVLSSAQKAVDIFKSYPLRESMATSDFDLTDIVDGNMTVYLCIPAERLATHAVWLRLLAGVTMTLIQRNWNKPVLMLMDEFYSLGYLSIIDKSMGLMPGYNLSLMPIVQDLGQLKNNYKESWETFIANSVIQTYLGIRDLTTAKYVSEKQEHITTSLIIN